MIKIDKAIQFPKLILMKKQKLVLSCLYSHFRRLWIGKVLQRDGINGLIKCISRPNRIWMRKKNEKQVAEFEWIKQSNEFEEIQLIIVFWLNFFLFVPVCNWLDWNPGTCIHLASSIYLEWDEILYNKKKMLAVFFPGHIIAPVIFSFSVSHLISSV